MELESGIPASAAYADVEAADAVATYRVGGAGWLARGDSEKMQALITASRDLDTLAFVGQPTTDAQELAWPRTGTDFADDAIPPRLVQATIEYAFLLAAGTGDVLNPATSLVKRERVDVIETEYFAPVTPAPFDLSRLPPIVQRLVAPLLLVVVLGGYGSGVAIRSS